MLFRSPDAVEARLAELCATLASRSMLSQVAAKQMIAAVLEHGAVPATLADGWVHEANRSGESDEGVAAFRERRPPRFGWTG